MFGLFASNCSFEIPAEELPEFSDFHKELLSSAAGMLVLHHAGKTFSPKRWDSLAASFAHIADATGASPDAIVTALRRFESGLYFDACPPQFENL